MNKPKLTYNDIDTAISNPDVYYQDHIAPRQAHNMEVIAPSVGLQLSGEDVRELFLTTFSKRSLAYHIWSQPRVCIRSQGWVRVYLREYGLVKNGEDGEGSGNVMNVFTNIQLDFDRRGKVRRLVSVRDNTLLGDELFDGPAPA